MREHHGNTLGEVVHKSLAREIKIRKKNMPIPSRKRGFQLIAPSGNWSDWTYVAAPIGPGSASNPTYKIIKISFVAVGNVFPSTFSVEIRGGNRLVTAIGDDTLNSAEVIIEGNVATQIDIRLKSHGAQQRVVINSSSG